MPLLINSINAWPGHEFNATLKCELESLPVDQLPLQRCLKNGNYALDNKPCVMVLSVTGTDVKINVSIGIMFNSIIAGCSCADDPTPVEELSEYCELLLALDLRSGQATFTQAE